MNPLNQLVINIGKLEISEFKLKDVIFPPFPFNRCLNPLNMLVGILTMVVLFGIFVFITNNKRETQKFKRDHPLVCFLVLVTVGYLAMRVFGSVLVFIWGIMVPIVCKYLKKR